MLCIYFLIKKSIISVQLLVLVLKRLGKLGVKNNFTVGYITKKIIGTIGIKIFDK